MNTTVIEHTLIAFSCTLAGWLLGNPVAGAAFGAALFLGREHAQAEYRYIERFCNGKRAGMPWYGGFTPVVWDLESLLDWACPLVTSIIAVLLLTLLR